MDIRASLDQILAMIEQATLSDDEWGSITLTGSPSRLDLYLALIPIITDRSVFDNGLDRLKAYALARDGLVIDTAAATEAAYVASSNIALGAVLE